MIHFIKNLFGGNKTDYKELVQKGAQIIDVRSPSEFQGGHIKGSKNIPLQGLSNELSKINKDQPVITVCASGMRSAGAKKILSKNGYEAYNGGGWSSLQNKLS